MTEDKSCTTPTAALATSGTSDTDNDNPTLQCLFETIGLGIGASHRAQVLVLKGILYENDEQLKLVAKQLKRGKGRPRKPHLNINIERATAVLNADDLRREKFGRSAPSIKNAIEFAKQIDEILCNAEPDRKPLFGPMTEFSTLQTSVSMGLRELGEDRKRFSKK